MVSKSAGGSLKARCEFSPMPTKATSIGARWSGLADGAADRVEIAVAVERVERPDAGAIDEVLVQHPAEAGRMIGGDADVLVEVEQLDPRPVDRRAGGEAVQEAELRVPRGGDDPGVSAGLDGTGEQPLGVRRRRGAHLVGRSGER